MASQSTQEKTVLAIFHEGAGYWVEILPEAVPEALKAGFDVREKHKKLVVPLDRDHEIFKPSKTVTYNAEEHAVKLLIAFGRELALLMGKKLSKAQRKRYEYLIDGLDDFIACYHEKGQITNGKPIRRNTSCDHRTP